MNHQFLTSICCYFLNGIEWTCCLTRQVNPYFTLNYSESFLWLFTAVDEPSYYDCFFFLFHLRWYEKDNALAVLEISNEFSNGFLAYVCVQKFVWRFVDSQSFFICFYMSLVLNFKLCLRLENRSDYGKPFEKYWRKLMLLRRQSIKIAQALHHANILSTISINHAQLVVKG